MPVILNYHTPTVSCPRGTLARRVDDLRWRTKARKLYGVRAAGARPGATDGVDAGVASSQRVAPDRPGGPGGRSVDRVRMPELIDLRMHSFHRMMRMVDGVMAL